MELRAGRTANRAGDVEPASAGNEDEKPRIATMRNRLSLLATVVAAWSAVATVQASPIQTNTEIDGTNTGLSTSVNLVTQGQSTFTSLASADFTPWSGGSSGIPALNDNSTNACPLDTNDASWTLKVSLNTTAAAMGYNVAEIKTISGWNADYVDQKYTLSYSTAFAPDTFITVGTYSLYNTGSVSGGLGNSARTLQIDLTDSSGLLAANVAKLQFVFQSAGGTYGHPTAYREIEVFGTAAPLPEPSTFALLGIGFAGLAAFGWRRRRIS
jgi:hypothetical protein